MQDNNVKNNLSALEIIIGVVNIISSVGLFMFVAECCRELIVYRGDELINVGIVIIHVCLFPLMLISPLWVRIFAKKPLTVFSITTYSITAWLWVVIGIIGWFVHG